MHMLDWLLTTRAASDYVFVMYTTQQDQTVMCMNV